MATAEKISFKKSLRAPFFRLIAIKITDKTILIASYGLIMSR
jgi:hypothetical protein